MIVGTWQEGEQSQSRDTLEYKRSIITSKLDEHSGLIGVQGNQNAMLHAQL
jgi:hypothetical protein